MTDDRPVGSLLQLSGAVVDLVYRIEALPSPGAEVLATSSDIAVGGGFNAMVSAVRAGLTVSYGGALGSGLFADRIARAMADFGFEILRPRLTGQDQGSCVVLVDGQGERSFISKDGAEGVGDPDGLAAITPAGFEWVLLSGYTLCYPGSRDLLCRWVEALPPEAEFVFDPSPVVSEIPPAVLRSVLAKARWISCNGREAEAITGQAAPEAAARALLEDHCVVARGAVVRLGAEGCLILERGSDPEHVPGFPVSPVVDTNGAGDTHIGAFLAALSRSMIPADAARYANAAAALSTRHKGPATAPDHSETMAFWAETFSDQVRSDGAVAHPGAAGSRVHRLVAGTS